MKLNPKQAEKIAGNPQKTAEAVDLVYITEGQLSIRRKRHGRGLCILRMIKRSRIRKP